MTSPDLLPEPAGPQPPVGPPPAAVRAGAPGLRGSRADVRGGVVVVVGLALLGLAAGLLWWWLAPRAQFTVTSTSGDVEVTGGGLVDPELFMADDGVFVLLLGGLGLLAGLVGWTQVRRRGVVTLVALAAGMLAASLTAWQLGALLGRGPSRADLTTVGREVTTALDLNMLASLAIGPFAAVLVYLVATVLASRDDLGREDGEPVRGEPEPVPVPTGPSAVPPSEGQLGPAVRE